MKQRTLLLFLAALCALGASGCRRKPIVTETQAQTETAKELATEAASETEALAKATETVTEKESETEKQPTKIRANLTQKETEQSEMAVATQNCPYCGNPFSTVAGSDGISEYDAHVAQEEAYIDAIGGDASDYQTGADGTLYAQCPYCFQWFSDAPGADGYSAYAEHVAAESAYANQMANEEYVQCPNCGNWVTQSEYQDHINGGW